ncbi:hypothetical protein BpHYR1_036988 [Brachionus plicatilis]|uniref:Uncharacterized protein n=1 Tax=Brachionus plicatilis TaxID=10195 RepID=A0A3M7SXL7_BRAPC|nr:hypothetical protein BpHYR1_036988 [Brachionus plicatilis]
MYLVSASGDSMPNSDNSWAKSLHIFHIVHIEQNNNKRIFEVACIRHCPVTDQAVDFVLDKLAHLVSRCRSGVDHFRWKELDLQSWWLVDNKLVLVTVLG